MAFSLRHKVYCSCGHLPSTISSRKANGRMCERINKQLPATSVGVLATRRHQAGQQEITGGDGFECHSWLGQHQVTHGCGFNVSLPLQKTNGLGRQGGFAPMQRVPVWTCQADPALIACCRVNLGKNSRKIPSSVRKMSPSCLMTESCQVSFCLFTSIGFFKPSFSYICNTATLGWPLQVGFAPDHVVWNDRWLGSQILCLQKKRGFGGFLSFHPIC